MLDTARALTREMDERGLAHLTASTTVNRPAMRDTMMYFARATVFGGEIRTQGFGVDASNYAGTMVTQKSGDNRLALTYAGVEGAKLPVDPATYEVREAAPPSDFYA